MAQTVILRGPQQRALACDLIRAAPDNAVVSVRVAKRTIPQNDKMWAMLSDISRSKPDGKTHTPEMWKALFMHSLKHEVQFVVGLDGYPFPVGFSSKKLDKQQMGELITFIYEYGDRHNVAWSEPNPYEET